MADPEAPSHRPANGVPDCFNRLSWEERDDFAGRGAARAGSGRAFDAGVPPEEMTAQRESNLRSGRPSFHAEEFADISDGRRVALTSDRGWSHWPRDWPQNMPSDSWRTVVGRGLTKETVLILDPDDNEDWVDWVVGYLHSLDIDVDPASVQAAPFRVEFGPRVQYELRQRRPEPVVVGRREVDAASSVVALGAICEIAYLRDPPRRPVPQEGVYARYPRPQDYPTPEELGATGPQPGRSVTFGSYFQECTPEELQAQRWEMFESGMRELYAEEFADLDDGRRVILKNDHWWDFWPVPRPRSSWRLANGRELTRQVIMVLDPRDHEEWMEWVIRRLRSLGVDADPASVHAAPFRVEFGPRVQHELRQRRPDR